MHRYSLTIELELTSPLIGRSCNVVASSGGHIEKMIINIMIDDSDAMMKLMSMK